MTDDTDAFYDLPMLVWLIVAIVLAFLVYRMMIFRSPAAFLKHKRKTPRRRESSGSSPLDGVRYAPRERRLFAPAEVAADGKIRELVRRYVAADESAREEIRDSLSSNDFSTLLAFAGRSAAFGRVDDAINAVAMIDIAYIDASEVPPVLACIHHAARKARVDTKKAFDRAAAMATPEMAREIAKFLEDYPPTTDVRDEWDFDEVPGGFIQRGDDPYKPSRDLARLIIEVAAIVEKDRYAVATVEIADNWAGAEGVEVRAGASLYANRRDESGEEQEDEQILTAYLLELPDAFRAPKFEQNDDTAQLVVTRGNLVCVVIQESSRVGEKPVETNESLKRFAAPIEKLLEG